MKAKLPAWPRPFEIARDNIEADTVSLSRLDSAAKREAFEAMKKQEPQMADFVARMHKRFGALELRVDSATAKRLGVKSK